jgi:AcrR family transcriptional regulator
MAMPAAEGAFEKEATTIWERPEPIPRPVPLSLTRSQIVAVAIGLADTEDLESVSLRKVAGVLEVGPMRLYGYVSSKDELLDLMIDSVYGEIPPVRRIGDDWRSATRAIAHEIRNAALRHEWIVDLLGARLRVHGPNALAYRELAFAALHGAPGFQAMDVVLQSVRTIDAYVLGAIRYEIDELRADRITGMNRKQWQDNPATYMGRMLAAGNYPTLAMVSNETTPPPPTEVFNTGLDHVLTGIAQRLALEA